jgi:hypothetical protein
MQNINPSDRLRLFAEILSELAYDQDPPSGYFEESLSSALSERNMSESELDALAKELRFDWRCRDEPEELHTLCKACGGGLAGSNSTALCCCAEGAKTDRGAELRHKASIGQCYQAGCAASADVDGWCDDHSEQFKKFGTHHAVGPYGPGSPGPSGGAE